MPMEVIYPNAGNTDSLRARGVGASFALQGPGPYGTSFKAKAPVSFLPGATIPRDRMSGARSAGTRPSARPQRSALSSPSLRNGTFLGKRTSMSIIGTAGRLER